MIRTRRKVTSFTMVVRVPEADIIIRREAGGIASFVFPRVETTKKRYCRKNRDLSY